MASRDTALAPGIGSRHRRLRASARGALVLADPPEAGWLLRTRSNEEATAAAELLAAPKARPPDQADRDPEEINSDPKERG